jgi:serine/threonine protein kinase
MLSIHFPPIINHHAMLVRYTLFKQNQPMNFILALPAYPSSTIPKSQTTTIHVNRIPYTIIRLLGEGLHSRVYAAYDPRMGQSVAIKIVENLDSREHSKMFLKEIRYLTKLQPRNPYVIRVYNHEFDNKSQTGKIVMETGHDFRFMLPLQAPAMEKKMSNAQAKFYWYQMVEAVALLHRNGIVHSG